MTDLIHQSDRIFVAGARGMAGAAICRALDSSGYKQLLTPPRSELDLSDVHAVRQWFANYQPEIVVLAAAKVGGIHANATYPADFLLENIQIEQNVIETAWRSGVRRLLFLGSSCIYSRLADQPIREDSLLTGSLERTNEWYAIAKIAGIKLCEALRLQYGFDAISVMPTNLYGPGDNYHPENSHVLPALLRRFHEAVQAGCHSVTCWGTGAPRREFLHVDDLGQACVHLLRAWSPQVGEIPFLNVGVGSDLPIRELAQKIANIVNYHGEILWDSSKPDGTPRKLLDVSRLTNLGWQAQISLEDGLRSTYLHFQQQLAKGALRL